MVTNVIMPEHTFLEIRIIRCHTPLFSSCSVDRGSAESSNLGFSSFAFPFSLYQIICCYVQHHKRAVGSAKAIFELAVCEHGAN